MPCRADRGHGQTCWQSSSRVRGWCCQRWRPPAPGVDEVSEEVCADSAGRRGEHGLQLLGDLGKEEGAGAGT